jgi:hypothetical protein
LKLKYDEQKFELIKSFNHFGIYVNESASLNDLNDTMETLKQIGDQIGDKYYGDKNAK